MNKIINTKLIERNKKIGKISSFAGIAILAVGLILNFNPTPTRMLISLGALVIGFLVAQVSTYYVSRFNRNPRADEVIAENLDKLNNDYAFYIYNSPVPMMLVGPVNIWVPVPIETTGEIYYDNKWKVRGGSAFSKFFGQGNIKQPIKELDDFEKQTVGFIKDILGEEEIPPVKSIFVVLNPKVTIGDVENAPNPIVHLDALRRKIRKFDRDAEGQIAPEVIQQINDRLSEFPGK